jgi:hypothetical protein
MYGRLGRLFGKYTEEMFFQGDQSPFNPARYLPTPFHTKYAQQRTALSQYIQQEAGGTRMRRWERPLHDFLLPYVCGIVARATGEDVIPEEVRHRRDLDTLADMLQFLRAESQAGRGEEKGSDRMKGLRPAPLSGPLPPSQSAPAPPGREQVNSPYSLGARPIYRAVFPPWPPDLHRAHIFMRNCAESRRMLRS